MPSTGIKSYIDNMGDAASLIQRTMFFEEARVAFGERISKEFGKSTGRNINHTMYAVSADHSSR
jgi:hypothetical protein